MRGCRAYRKPQGGRSACTGHESRRTAQPGGQRDGQVATDVGGSWDPSGALPQTGMTHGGQWLPQGQRWRPHYRQPLAPETSAKPCLCKGSGVSWGLACLLPYMTAQGVERIPRPAPRRPGYRHGYRGSQSMNGSLPPPLLQNRACHFCGTRLLSDAPFVMRHLSGCRHTAVETCDLTFRASPLRDIAPSRYGVGSSACAALLPPITCTSPPARQHIRGITLGLGFLGDPLPMGIRLAPAHDRRMRARIRLLRSQFPWLASVGRCFPPGFLAVQTGQYCRLPAPYPVPFWLQRVSLLRWVVLTMAHHTFACAAHRCLLDGIPGVRLPGSAVSPRFRPLRTSRGSGGYAVTPAPGGRDLHPHGELSYKAYGFAVCPRTSVLFRPTGRTEM